MRPDVRAVPCAVPGGARIVESMEGAHFQDCYRIDVDGPRQTALGHLLVAISRTPGWVETLMRLRNRLAGLAGLKNLGTLGGIDPAKPEGAYLPGDARFDTFAELGFAEFPPVAALQVFADLSPALRLHGLQRLVEHRHGLRQVEDVDAVAVAVDVFRHPRVPALGLVTVVNASFKKLTHGEFGKRHSMFLSGLRLGGVFRADAPTGGPSKDFSPRRPDPTCEVRAR